MISATCTSCLEAFDRVRDRLVEDPRFGPPWICKTGLWPDSKAPKAAVLKVLKQYWSPDPAEVISSSIGIFFSVWSDDTAISKGGLHYNLHALKLRQLPVYALESRKFANAFRTAFQTMSADWPEVSTDYGPQTLFQGFVTCPATRVESATFELVERFDSPAGVIDRLLSAAAKKAPAT